MTKVTIKKILSLFLCMALITSVLVSCSGSDNASNAPREPAATNQDDKPTEPSPASSNDEEVTISILDWNTEANMSAGVQAMVDLYAKDHPNVKFEIQQLDSANLFVTYKNRIAAGSPPELYQGKPRNYLEFIEGGFVKDLTNEPIMKSFKEDLVAELEVDGKLWGIPLDAQAKGVFYNKKMFEEAGVEVPTTRDEFFAVMDKFVEKGINPLCQPLGANNNAFHIVDAVSTAMFEVRGEPDIWKNSDQKGEPVAGNPLAKEVFEFYDKLLKYKDPNDPGVSISEAVQDFGVGKRPMMINGGWFIGEVYANAKDVGLETDFGYFPIPWSNNPEENKMWIGLDQVFIVSSKAENEEILMDFINTFMGPEGAKIWMDHSGAMTSRTDVELANALPHIFDMQSYLDKNMSVSKAKVYDYSSEALIAFKDKIQAFGSLPDGERNVDKFLEELDSEIASIRN